MRSLQDDNTWDINKSNDAKEWSGMNLKQRIKTQESRIKKQETRNKNKELRMKNEERAFYILYMPTPIAYCLLLITHHL